MVTGAPPVVVVAAAVAVMVAVTVAVGAVLEEEDGTHGSEDR